MRIKINLLAKTDMGSTSTPRPNQRHQQVAWASSTTSVSIFWPNKPYIDFVQKTFALNAFELWRPLAQLRQPPATSGKFVRSCAELRRAGFWVAMGSYGHPKSSYTFWGHLEPFASSGETCQRLPEVAGGGYAISVNRITASVLVSIGGRVLQKFGSLVALGLSSPLGVGL